MGVEAGMVVCLKLIPHDALIVWRHDKCSAIPLDKVSVMGAPIPNPPPSSTPHIPTLMAIPWRPAR